MHNDTKPLGQCSLRKNRFGVGVYLDFKKLTPGGKDEG